MSSIKYRKDPIMGDGRQYERVISKNYWGNERNVVYVLEIPVKPEKSTWYTRCKNENR